MSQESVAGRRGAVVRRAALAATLAELAERGYGALTVEHVAARAGVHKTTIYRRWPDREALVTDALLEVAADDFTVPDTGDVDADLETWVRALGSWLVGPVGRPLVAMLGSDTARLPVVVEARHRFFAVRAAAMGSRVTSAVAAGQLPPETSPAALLSTVVAPLYLALLVTGQPLEPADCDRAARVALVAARAGVLG
jgi:AcrR family transcriptional regulator